MIHKKSGSLHVIIIDISYRKTYDVGTRSGNARFDGPKRIFFEHQIDNVHVMSRSLCGPRDDTGPQRDDRCREKVSVGTYNENFHLYFLKNKDTLMPYYFTHGICQERVGIFSWTGVTGHGVSTTM